ncbi:MAG: hypothetical protein KJO55_00450 [Gammaproteobacteria bacterium]|nr:hypothetical protein [Gammaproteobacteria bacterium]
MKRILAVLAGLIALSILGFALLRDIGTIEAPAATSSPVATNAAEGIQLELATRLQSVPTTAPRGAPVPVVESWQGSKQWRYLLYLLAAAMIGIVMTAFARSRALVSDDRQLVALQSELDDRGDAIHDLEQALKSKAQLDSEISREREIRHELEQQLADTTAALEQAEQALTGQQQSTAASDSEREQLAQSVDRLENELLASTQKIESLEHQLQQAEDLPPRIEALKQELAVSNAEIRQLLVADDEQSASAARMRETLELELDTWKETLSAVEKELDERKEQIAALETERNEALTAVDTARDECDKAQTTIAGLERDLDALRHAEKQLSADLGEQVQLLDHERRKAANEINTLAQEVEQRDTRFSALQHQLQEKSRLLDELRSTIDADEQRIRELETEIGDLSDYRDKLENWDSTVVTLQADLRDRDRRNTELLGEIERLQQLEVTVAEQQDSITGLQQELDHQVELAQTMKRGVDTLRHNKELAEQRLLEIEALQAELSDSDAEIEQWRNRIPPLEQALTERDNEIDSLRSQLDREATTATDLERELADWRVKVTALETALRERDAGLDDLRTQLAEATTARDSLHSEVEGVVEQRQSLDEDLRYYAEQLEQAEKALEHEQSQHADARNELERLQNLEGRLAEWDSTVATLQADLRERDRTLHTLLDDFGALTGANVTVTDWPDAIDAQRRRIEEYENTITQLRESIVQLEQNTAQLTAREQELEQAESLLAQRDERIAALDETVAGLRADQAELAASQSRVEQLQHRLRESQTDLEAIRVELDRNLDAKLRAEQLTIEATAAKRELKQLRRGVTEKDQRIDDLEMDVAGWIDKHAHLKSRFEAQRDQLKALQTQMTKMPKDIPSLKVRAPGDDDLPTQTSVVKPGERNEG